MTSNVTRTNTGKLLVAVLAIFMIVAGAAVLFSEEANADGYSTADDLQKALNEAKETGATVTVDNRLVIDKAITIPDNVTLNIKSAQIWVKGGSITGGTITQNNHNGLTIYSGSISEVTFKDFRMAISGAPSVNGNISITDCVFDSTGSTDPQSAIYFDGSEKFNYTVSGCTFTGDYEQGTLNFDVRSGSQITVNVSDSGNYSVGIARGDLVMGETITYDGEITALNIAADASVTVPENYTLTVTGTITNEGTIYKNGTIVGEVTGNVIESGSTEIADASNSTAISNALNDPNIEEVTLTGGTLASVSVPANKTLTITSDVTIADNPSITVADDATVNFNIVADANGDGATFVVKNDADTNITITNAIGSFTITGGSIIYKDIINASMEIGGTGDVIFQDAIIPSNVTITLANEPTYSVSGSLTVYGKIVAADSKTGVEINVEKVGETVNSIKAYPGASFGEGVKIVGDGKIDISDAMSTVTLNDDIETTVIWSQTQKVVIADTLTIKEGRTMTVLGELVINEGCTVIIEDGASLVVGDEANTIKATGVTVNGNIEVETNGTFLVDNAEDVTVVGTVTSSGTVTINSNVTVKNGGSIVIEDYENAKGEQISGISVIATAKFVIENGGELTVSGKMDIMSIANAGTVTLDGAVVSGNTEMDLTADGAVADIKSMTFGTTGIHLYVRDIGMYLFTDDNDEDVTIVSGEHNAVAIDAKEAQVGIRNLTVTASLTSEQVDKNTTKYHNSLIISGSPSIYDDKDTGEFSGFMTIVTKANSNGKTYTGYATESSIEVPESLTLGKNIVLSQNAGPMNVDGNITATTKADVSDATPVIKTDGTGVINVNGMITIVQDNKQITGGINAFFYEDDDNYYYTTLKTAVDNGAEDIEYYGNVKVLDSLTVPAGTELSKGNNAGTITIGDEDNRDVIVTIADGATVKNCTIDVMATLVFEDNKTDNRTTNVISSDVIIDETPKRTYTNIYTALDDAADNSTVTISRNIFLDKDAEIRETITLAIPASYGVYLDDEVTLTVNGTIQNSGKIDAGTEGLSNQPVTDGMAGFNPYTDAENTVVNEERSEIVVNGTIMSMTEMKYDKYYIPGAYYQMVNDSGAWYYITPVEQAAAVSNDVQKGEIAIYGENTVGDVAFTGDEVVAVKVTVNGDLDAGTVTLTLATLDVKGSFDGTVGSAVGTIDVVNGKGFTVVDTLVGTDDVQTLYLTGNPVAADDELDASVTVATGTVNAGQIEIKAPADDARTTFDFVIASGATLMVAGDYGTDVAKFTAEEMIVDGTLVANDDGLVDVDTLTVRGTFTVMAADDEADTNAGKADITTLYVGIAKDDKTGKFVDASAATVNAESLGNYFANAYVSGESTITADLVSKMYSTEFYVEDALWLTAYSNAKNVIKISEDVRDGDETYVNYVLQPGDLNNSAFVSWNDENGEALEGNVYVGDSDASKVYATLDYDIYTVTVFADPGIEAVYIDGKLMTSGTFQTGVDGMWAQGFRLSVAAGEHEITYKLGNYFSGEAKMTVNGSAVDGNKFTTSGTTTADMNVTIYLQGIEASAPETPSTGGSSDEMGLTDYLLIILVVLIVVMAIMVAMRLMRS